MLTLVRLRGIMHVYDGAHRRFVKRNARNVAQALGETGQRTLRAMLASAEWIADNQGRERYVARRHGENGHRARKQHSTAW